MGMANFFNSNFWMTFKSAGLITWMFTALVAALQAYKTYGEPETAAS